VNIPVSLSWLPTETVTVDYNVTGGTAANGEDYSLPAGTLQFEPCEVTKYVGITIAEDDLHEDPDETIEISLSGPSNSRLGPNTLHTYTILPPMAKICPDGDLNGDCDVDFNDVEIFAGQWLDPPESCAGYMCANIDDLDGVDMRDFAVLANNWLEDAWPIVINEFMASNGDFLLDPCDSNETPDWFELYNASAFPVDLGGMYLTDELADPTQYEIPSGVTIPAKGYLLFYADNSDNGEDPMRTNFALRASGEEIGLFDTDGTTPIDYIIFEEQATDISYGRYPDAGDHLRFFGTPSPEAENSGAYAAVVADTKFSHDRGFYDAPFSLSITCNTGGAEIRYTTDGNKPTETSGTVYTGPIDINSTTCLRAAAFKPSWMATNVDTHTYIFGANSVRKELPTISLVSGELVDRIGPVSMELIYGDANDGEGFQADCESDEHSTHSYRIKYKAAYGRARLDYPFFEAAPLYADSAADRFDRIVLRNYSQRPVTWVAEPWTRFTQLAMSGPGHGGHSMYVHFYINGIYQGLINPVERPDAWFASSYFGGDFEDYFATNHNELSDENYFLSGDPTRYETLLAMAGAKNLEDPNNYEDFKELCDVTQFADYVILYWYADFHDGLTNNYYAFMRNVPLEGSVPPEGLMYFMWDAEFTLRGPPSVDMAFFNGITRIPVIWQALVENADFRILLADRVYKHCFNDGALMDENAQARWDVIYDHIASGGVTPYIDEEWRGISGSRDVFIDLLRDWYDPCWPGIDLYPGTDPPTFNQRGGHVAGGFSLEMYKPNGGDIYYTLDGSDPREAVTGNPVGTSYSTPVTLTQSVQVKARILDGDEWSALNEVTFGVGPVADSLRITEVMYHPEDANDPNTEFIELQNIGVSPVNLSLVSFTNGIDFVFPSSLLAPSQCVVVVKDQNSFEAMYGTGINVAGEYTGRFNNGGERVELVDAVGQTIHNFRYEDSWRPITDGDGYSLALIDPTNSDPNSWSEKDSWRAS
ncbi:MAG: lamin tail domain-containing protein, partial [Planctomycetota bacterium]